MAETLHSAITSFTRPSPRTSRNLSYPTFRSFKFHATLTCCMTNNDNSSKKRKNQVPRKSSQKPYKPVIKLSLSDSNWNRDWSAEYALSLRELGLEDLACRGEQHARVIVRLSAQKHTGMGFSVMGRVVTSFTRRCGSCSSIYRREIDEPFDAWIMPEQKKTAEESRIPEVGWKDPSVIYVRPGLEAHIDSVVQDTIRLTTTAKEKCSPSCAKSATVIHYSDVDEGEKGYNPLWSKLLELKESIEKQQSQ